MVRLLNNKMNVSRNTVYNWFRKGSYHLKKVLPVLKEKLLAKGAVVNCDETWCRVKVNGKYGKKYIWCMVNKEAKVAVYFYDDGSRGLQQERQGEQTTKIIQKIRQRLDKLLADTSGMRGDLMNKALNYLKSFWNQLILYLKDGRYSIDNSLAERTLRPMTVERKRSTSGRLLPKRRKNSLTFGSHDGAEVSVIYHTFIETCKMCGVSTLEYFKEFFKAIMQGRTDYENMLPMTIGIKK